MNTKLKNQRSKPIFKDRTRSKLKLRDRTRLDFESILTKDRKFESIPIETRLEHKNKDRTRLDSLESHVWIYQRLLKSEIGIEKERERLGLGVKWF